MAPPGFLRPRQIAPLDASQERLIARACPGLRVAPWVEPTEPPQGNLPRKVHFAWGPYREVLTGHALEDEVRFVGSSGGMLTALAQHALREDLVDAIVSVKGGDGADPLANRVTVTENADETLQAAGSRYGPSGPLVAVGELLNDARRFLFVGKPCDVSALRQLAKEDPRVDERFPFMLSFFCGGMPSRGGSEAVVSAMGLRPDELSYFRYRGNGWPGKARAETRDGQSAEMDYETSWGAHLSKDVQFRCKICPDAVGGVADIACADAWYGGEKGYPSFEDREGRSLVMVRTEAGARLLEGALSRETVTVEPLAIEEIDLMQPSQRRRKTLISARRAAMAVAFLPQPDFSGLLVGNAAKHAPLQDRARNFLGTLSRIFRGKR